MNRIDLSGHCAVITGGAEGIGLAVAERLSDSGALLSLWDVDEKLLKITADRLSERGKVHFRTVNVTNADEVQSATESVAQELGRVDILVASAGITGPNAKCWEYPVDA